MEEHSFTVTCRLGDIEPVQEEIKRILQAGGFRLKQIHAVLLALGEWLEYLVQNSSPGATPGTIAVDLRVDGAEVRFRIADDGPALTLPAAPTPGARSAAGGGESSSLNVQLMRGLVDHVEFSREHGRNVLVMAKHLIPPT